MIANSILHKKNIRKGMIRFEELVSEFKHFRLKTYNALVNDISLYV